MSLKDVLTRLANQIRTLLGHDGNLTLAQMGDQTAEAVRQVGIQQDTITRLFEIANSLPNKGGSTLENCSVTVDVAGINTFGAWAFVVGGQESHMAFETDDWSGATQWKKNSVLTLYAPGNTGATVTGDVTILETSGDGAVIAFKIAGPGSIKLTA